MPAIVQRCVQCGGSSACEANRVPPYGARLRCPECGNLLPLLVASALESLPRQAAPAAPGTRAEARRFLELWVAEARRTAATHLSGARLREKQEEELERLRVLWRSSFPGVESVREFEEELQTALARLDSEAAR
jgi:hypothetical protein